MQRRNTGVEERDRRDKLEVKTTADRVGECYAALERKAQLYEKLARGELDDEGEQYEVDFLRKGGAAEEEAGGGEGRRGGDLVDTMLQAVSGTGGMMTADMARERERRDWERDQQRIMADEEAEERRRKQKEALLWLGEQTREERQRAEAVKVRKEEAVRSKREELKAKFLRDQVAKKLAGAGAKAVGGKKS
ncbi:hypothetical protein CHLRE_12g523832v5 [Chlamydomonas reinhardtii]|uniref:Uncharacterized protein n=1 Tax=Chlamydomonas reinhardtii TaxID=3055 RepID=A0A2K3D493_CHLRE|nr:uncharacterized protein CHLRE_12g523832v5 [Chlamydomonas reinhardtii]PNW75358.1 hypothetical protein CHLRE_12g523832v5 [Chlamydomonas reinhardtii]